MLNPLICFYLILKLKLHQLSILILVKKVVSILYLSEAFKQGIYIFLVSGAMSVFENQGRFFILTTPTIGSTDSLYLYTLNGNVLVLSQNISVSFTATSNLVEIPLGYDFKVATGQFHKRF